MSFIYSDINPEYGSTSVWKVTENASFFQETLNCEVPLEYSKSDKRSLEWLSSRYIIQKCEDVKSDEIDKDEFGKPHFKTKKKNLSISHSNGYAAVALYDFPIGIDIQTFVAKIQRIESKYTQKSEVNHYLSFVDKLKALHIIWTIKESVFKLYGRKELPFKEGILLDKAIFNPKDITTLGRLKKKDDEFSFQSKTILSKDYCLSQAKFIK
tara:strand:- start:1664 stop:2296 length:633 start_codon:yes stop_codon:yes gene_type:complete